MGEGKKSSPWCMQQLDVCFAVMHQLETSKHILTNKTKPVNTGWIEQRRVLTKKEALRTYSTFEKCF